MIVTLESLLDEKEIVEEVTSEDVNNLLVECNMECADMLCEMNTYEAASLVCEASNDKNIFKQMITKIKAAIKWIKDTWVNKIWPKIKAFFQKIFKGKKVDEKKAEEAVSQAMKDDPKVEATVEKIIPADDLKEMVEELKEDVSSSETPVERKARKQNKSKKNRPSKNEVDPADAAYAVSHSDEYYTIGDMLKGLAEKKQKKLESEIAEAEKKIDSASDEEIVEIKETISALNEEVSETVKVVNETTASMTAAAKIFKDVVDAVDDGIDQIFESISLDKLDELVNDFGKDVPNNINAASVGLTPNNPYNDSSKRYFDINISYGVKNGGNTKFDTNLAKKIRVDHLGDMSGSGINKGGITYVRENGKFVRV